MTGSNAAPSFSGTAGEFIDAGRGQLDDDEKLIGPDDGEPLVAFVDSSALVALADAGDASHQAAVAAYHDLVATGYRLFTTDYMLNEAFELLRAGPGLEVARDWLRACRLVIYHVSEQDVAKAKRRVLDGTGAEGISLGDAISLVVMDRLAVTDVFAVDQSVLNVIS